MGMMFWLIAVELPKSMVFYFRSFSYVAGIYGHRVKQNREDESVKRVGKWET